MTTPSIRTGRRLTSAGDVYLADPAGEWIVVNPSDKTFIDDMGATWKLHDKAGMIPIAAGRDKEGRSVWRVRRGNGRWYAVRSSECSPASGDLPAGINWWNIS